MADHDTPVLRKRLISSLVFLVILMYFSMGHTMWGWPVPAFFQENYVALGLLQLLLTAAVMVINQKFFYQRFSEPIPSGAQYGYPGGVGGKAQRRLSIVPMPSLP